MYVHITIYTHTNIIHIYPGNFAHIRPSGAPDHADHRGIRLQLRYGSLSTSFDQMERKWGCPDQESPDESGAESLFFNALLSRLPSG